MKNKVYEESSAITPELLNKIMEQIRQYSEQPDMEMVSFPEFQKRQHIFLLGFFNALENVQLLMKDRESIVPSGLEWAIHFLKKNIIERSRKGEL